MALLNSLPSRPLYNHEAESLMDQSSDTVKIMPCSFLQSQDETVVPTLLVSYEDQDRAVLVGFNPEPEGWEETENWDSLEEAMAGFEDAATAWGESVFDEQTTHGKIDMEEFL